MIFILIITIQGFTSNTTNARICFKKPKLPGTSSKKFTKHLWRSLILVQLLIAFGNSTKKLTP